MPKRYIKFDNFGGGISGADFVGKKGSHIYEENTDFSDPSILRPNHKMLDDSTGTIAAAVGSYPIKDFLEASDGYIYALGVYSTYAILYRKADNDSLWTTVVNNTAGTPPYNGNLVEYDDYLYFLKSSTVISRYGPLSGTPSLTEDWQTGLDDLTGAIFVSGDKLYFANKNYVSSWDGTTFTAAALDLSAEERVNSFANWRNYLVIGADTVKNMRRSRLYFWDKSSSSWNDVIEIPDRGELTLYNLNQTLYIISTPNFGDAKLYSWRGGGVKTEVTIFRRVDFTQHASVSAIDVRAGVLYFGFYDVGAGAYIDGLPYSGVFAFKPADNTTDKALYLPFTNHLNDATNITVRALKWINDVLYISYFEHYNDYWYINRSDTYYNENQYYDDLVWESLKLRPNQRFGKVRLRKAQVNYASLPADCSVALKYKLDDAASWTTAFTADTDSSTSKTGLINSSQFDICQFRLDLTSATAASARPELYNLIVELETTKEL